MKKRNQKKEKTMMNETYALKYQKRTHEVESERTKENKRRGGLYGNWCRIEGHPPNCNCTYV